MKNSFTTLTQVIISILIVYTIGCGGSQEDDSDTFVDETHVPEKTISANPPTGSTIEPNDSITVVFNNITGQVNVVAINYTPSEASEIATELLPIKWQLDGRTLEVNGDPNFQEGALSLTIFWGDSSETLTYTVSAQELPDDE